jgi:hypothetical protein
MGKIIDRLIFALSFLAITFAWGTYIFKDWKAALILSLALYAGARVVMIFLNGRRKNLSNISPQETCLALALMGGEKAAELFFNTLPESLRESREGNFYVAIVDGKRTLVYVNYKFGLVNEEDVAKAYRKCLETGIRDAIILSAKTDRRVMIFAARLPVNFRFPDRRIVRKYLIDHNALPEKIGAPRKIKIPFKFKEAVSTAIEKRRIKYYLFVGLTLFVMSFFTPLKLYYLILTSFPLILTVCSAIWGE